MRQPLPDRAIIAGAVLTLFGFVLPWFKVTKPSPSYSGWDYVMSRDGGGWTLWIFAWLAVVVIAGLWARQSAVASMTVMAAAVGTLIFCLVLVTVSFARTGDSNMDDLTGMHIMAGLPILVIGLGLLLAAAVRAVVVSSSAAPAEPIRR